MQHLKSSVTAPIDSYFCKRFANYIAVAGLGVSLRRATVAICYSWRARELTPQEQYFCSHWQAPQLVTGH
jgi:hypothetical protein